MRSPIPILKRSHLRFLLSENNLSLAKLGALSGVARTNLSRWEAGDGAPSPTQALALARALGVNPTELFEWEDGEELFEGSIEQVLSRIQGLARLVDREGARVPELMDTVRAFSGERLREARTLVRCSQLELATKLDVNRATILRWEQGRSRPDSAQAYMLGRILEKHTAWFYVEAPRARRLSRTTQGSEHGELRRLLFECWQQEVSFEELAERSGVELERVERIFRRGSVLPREAKALREALGLADGLDLCDSKALLDTRVRQELAHLAAGIAKLGLGP